MERIGIYSGTFDPPHLGHVRAAQSALTAQQLDRILVIPDGDCPAGQSVASRKQRLEMLCLAFAEMPGIQVAEQEPENCEAIRLEAHEEGLPARQLQRMLVFHCASDFVPEPVLNYILAHGLYAVSEDLRNLPEERLERNVMELLKPNRRAHVLGCRDTAVALAKRYGVNETDAARAALLHDVTKALDGPLQLTLCSAYGMMLDDFSAKNPKTLHALTGSLVAQRIFGENEAVVQAIRCHTTGKADMNLLEKIIYVADSMEPNRDFPGVEKLRSLAYEDITEALKLGLHMTLEMLTQRGSEISPESREALAFLEGAV